MSAETAAPVEAGVVGKLSAIDRFLPVWILAVMALGLLAGRFVPGLATGLDAVAIDGTSVPIALGLLVMMYRCSRRSATTAWSPSPATAGC